jgi:hypothetical protein
LVDTCIPTVAIPVQKLRYMEATRIKFHLTYRWRLKSTSEIRRWPSRLACDFRKRLLQIWRESSWTSENLKMKKICFSETLVTIYQTKRHKILEHMTLHKVWQNGYYISGLLIFATASAGKQHCTLCCSFSTASAGKQHCTLYCRFVTASAGKQHCTLYCSFATASAGKQHCTLYPVWVTTNINVTSPTSLPDKYQLQINELVLLLHTPF